MGAIGGHVRPARVRLAAAAVIGAVLVALALLGVAIARFPGGSDCDPSARGFDPWCNYLSDLLHEGARGGRANPAAPVARAAVLVFVAALPPFWALLARLVPGRGRALRALGTLSAAGWAAMALLPSDRFGPWHGGFILLGAGPGVMAAALAVRGLWPARPVLATLGLAALACVGAATALFVRLLLGVATAPSLAIPALQKLGAVFLVAWVLGVAAASVARR